MAKEIKSESKFFLKFIVELFKLPFVLVMVFLKKKNSKELFKSINLLLEFLFEAKFTIVIIMVTILTSFYSWMFFNEELFKVFVNYPSDIIDPARWFSFFSCGFLHGGMMHLFSNMLGIFIFGRVVERKFGTGKTALIYFCAMFISSIGNSVIGLFFGDGVGSIGASGALMGLVAVAMLIDPFYLTYELLFPLPVMVVAWLTILADITGVISPIEDGVAHFAHIFGYLSVIFLAYFMNKKEREAMKKGLLINMASLIVFGLIYYFIIARYFVTN